MYCIYLSSHPRVNDAEGSMKVTEVSSTPLVQDLLNHDVSSSHRRAFSGDSNRQTSFSHLIVSSAIQDCFLLDQGGLKIFVWKGKKANKAEKQAAMSRALVRDR